VRDGLNLVLYASILFILLALILFFLAARQRLKAGIPAGRVIYTDTNKWAKVEKPLFDPELRLTGKPDYLVRHGKQVIPIEVKSSRAHREPPDWHIYQLAAYCVLAEHEFGSRPPHGILHYPNRTLAIDFTPALEAATKATVREMQERTSQIQVERSHHDQYRCLHCGYRSICDQALRI
jgi:CRISPR-associated exonuclease Cas4